MGIVQGLNSNHSQVHSHFGNYTCESYKCLEHWLKTQKKTKLRPYDTIKKVLKRRCLKCLCIVHLDVICMNSDQQKGWELNWKFDSQPQIPCKQGSNEVQLKCVIPRWKSILKCYKTLSSHSQNRLNVKKI